MSVVITLFLGLFLSADSGLHLRGSVVEGVMSNFELEFLDKEGLLFIFLMSLNGLLLRFELFLIDGLSLETGVVPLLIIDS